MKKRIFWQWSLGLVLASLPLAGGCDQEIAQSAPAPMAIADPAGGSALDAITNAPTPEAAEQQLENATGRVVSVANSPASSPNVSAPTAEIVKLTQAGVDENVMLSYVTNSAYTFGLSSDDIIYLNDIGVPGTVVTAMIQHDQALRGTATPTPPPDTNQLVPAPGTPTPYPTPVPETTQPPDTTPTVVENVPPPPQANVSYSYFYDSLSPYGNWIEVDGYGLCWQPTVVVVNRGWSPYCDNGHWVYSDYGWYWVSDYSWGWAPFHYGRWFRHARWGWCWAPDTVWGPAWVTWRYTPDYCGWAPLPPTACYAPGFGFTYFGRSIGIGFGFGLRADCFTFVAVNFFCDRHPGRHRLPPHHVTQIFNNTVVVNQIVNRNNRIVNEGIPVRHIADASHTVIRPVRVRDVADPLSARSEHIDRGGGRAVGAFRPNLPAPTGRTTLVGQGVRPATRNEVAPRIVGSPRNQGSVLRQQPLTSVNSTPQDRRAGTVPVFRNDASDTSRADRRPDNTARGARPPSASGANAPMILRGSDRSGRPDDNAAPPRSVIMRGSRDQNPPPMVNPAVSPTVQPARPTPPVQNNSRPSTVNPNPRQYTIPPPQGQPAAPSQNQRVFRQEPPGQMRQDQRQLSQPSAPTPSQSMPTYRWAPAAEPREQQRTFNPAPQSPPPSYRSDPAPRPEPRQVPPPSFRSDPAPRSEPRQAPSVRSDPAPQQSAPSRDNRQDRQPQQDRGSSGSRQNR